MVLAWGSGIEFCLRKMMALNSVLIVFTHHYVSNFNEPTYPKIGN